LPILEQIAPKLGLPQREEQRWARHPLVCLMEVADDIRYALIDWEDSQKMELPQYAEVESLRLDLVGGDLPAGTVIWSSICTAPPSVACWIPRTWCGK
jgi:hypothetical protein